MSSPTTAWSSCMAAAIFRSTRRTARSPRSRSACSTFDSLKTVYSRIGEQPRGIGDITEDTIGVIQFEFADWRTAAAGARDHGCDPRQDRGHSGRAGRGDGAARRARRPASRSRSRSARSIPRCCRRSPRRSRRSWRSAPDIRDLDDGQPLPGIDWKIEVDKAEAAKYGAGPSIVGTAVQLVTNGVKVTEYRPVRQRQGGRHPGAVSRRPAQPRRRSTNCGCRPRWATCRSAISSSRVPAPRVGYINRVAGYRVMTVSANVAGRRADRQDPGGASPTSCAKADLGPGVVWQAQGRGRGARQGLAPSCSRRSAPRCS